MTEFSNADMIHRLKSGDKEIVLVGTAHVSRESARQVEEVISNIKPDTVCVELCESRYQSIRHKEKWLETDIVSVIREKKAFLLLSNLILASFQKRLADKLDVAPGEEMIRAIQSAEAIGANICLADRDIRTTLARAWGAMGFFAKIKLLSELLLSLGNVEEISAEEVEKLKQEDMLETLLVEIGKEMPVLREILIDERDAWLAEKIRTASGKNIVAVVGAGHVPGIKKNWEKDVDIGALASLPPKGRLSGFLKWFIPAAILGLMVAGFWFGGVDNGSGMVVWWVATTGILAALGALSAMAHPLTILSAALAAPITCLHPLIAAGWVAGLVEAFSRKPKVRDFEDLSKDILTFRGFWRNKITKILLVVVLTNVGASLGTFVAIPLMLKVL
jgi:pheromone shutdown-related protein TraB